MSGISKVAVSFAWSEEKNGKHKSAVQKFCDALTQMGIEVVKDSLCLKYGANLEKFMREDIGKSGYLCVFLSEAYLKSHNCMYELLVAYLRAYNNSQEFVSRVRIWHLSDVSKYAVPSKRKPLMKHWKKLADEQVEYQKNHPTISDLTLRKIRAIKDVETNLDGILQTATEHLFPQSYEDFLGWVKSEVMPPGPVGPVSPENVFPNVISEINGILQADSNVAAFVCQQLPAIFQQNALSKSVLAGNSDVVKSFVTSLIGVEKQLKLHRGFKPESRRNLLRIFGGLLVLSVDPAWVVHQRSRWERESVLLPGIDEKVSLGSGRDVSWLELSLWALADSHARLDRVFLKPAETGRRVAALPAVGESIGASADQDAVKLHLIRCVLGGTSEIPPANDAAARRVFEQRYQDALNVMKVARHHEHDPYYAYTADKSDAKQKLRSDLELPDLLLFSSPSGEPDKFLNDYIALLSAFYRLFDLLN